MTQTIPTLNVGDHIVRFDLKRAARFYSVEQESLRNVYETYLIWREDQDFHSSSGHRILPPSSLYNTLNTAFSRILPAGKYVGIEAIVSDVKKEEDIMRALGLDDERSLSRLSLGEREYLSRYGLYSSGFFPRLDCAFVLKYDNELLGIKVCAWEPSNTSSVKVTERDKIPRIWGRRYKIDLVRVLSNNVRKKEHRKKK